ncbi:ABC transporter permease [Agromyces archimandritae]|uniref:ABC transporter permease subunit n=1 Tax=Agromyces archimandritae TaxID=2781962 RepID=A0A975IR86_9MICO|nr:ABC transporter permease subunit [Agromyces archimandritae]QTX05826.1 ABC transporter permease subunit [Agromyces archimandritae]
MRAVRTHPVVSGLIGVVALIAVWWIGAALFFQRGDGTGAVPTPPDVVTRLIEDGWAFYSANLAVTLGEAGIGYLFGNVLALLIAAVVLVFPRAETVAMQVAVVSYCIPIVAIGPIIFIVIGAPKTGEASGTAVVLAGLSVFFTTMVGSVLGFKSADRASLDLVRAYGGGSFAQLRFVRLRSALPGIFASLQIAAPAAFLGAILGEYFGGVDVGLGPAMTYAMQNLDAARLWGIALVSGLVAGGAYALIGLAGRIVNPWVHRERRSA